MISGDLLMAPFVLVNPSQPTRCFFHGMWQGPGNSACDLFGMAKWPFQRISDLQPGGKKVTNWITWVSFFPPLLRFGAKIGTNAIVPKKEPLQPMGVFASPRRGGLDLTDPSWISWDPDQWVSGFHEPVWLAGLSLGPQNSDWLLRGFGDT